MNQPEAADKTRPSLDYWAPVDDPRALIWWLAMTSVQRMAWRRTHPGDISAMCEEYERRAWLAQDGGWPTESIHGALLAIPGGVGAWVNVSKTLREYASRRAPAPGCLRSLAFGAALMLSALERTWAQPIELRSKHARDGLLRGLRDYVLALENAGVFELPGPWTDAAFGLHLAAKHARYEPINLSFAATRELLEFFVVMQAREDGHAKDEGAALLRAIKLVADDAGGPAAAESLLA